MAVIFKLRKLTKEEAEKAAKGDSRKAFAYELRFGDEFQYSWFINARFSATDMMDLVSEKLAETETDVMMEIGKKKP